MSGTKEKLLFVKLFLSMLQAPEKVADAEEGFAEAFGGEIEKEAQVAQCYSKIAL